MVEHDAPKRAITFEELWAPRGTPTYHRRGYDEPPLPPERAYCPRCHVWPPFLVWHEGEWLCSPCSRPEAGQGLVEYALLLAMIAVVAIVALSFIGSQIVAVLSTVGSSIVTPP